MPRIDTLSASTLGQRADLLPLKGQTEVGGVGAAAGVEDIANDARIPSRQALDLLLGDETGADVLPSSDSPTLSIAARAISAILGPAPTVVDALRGSTPVWPSALTPAADQLAAALARTVSASGLFYESHLRQFALGKFTPEELAQEPQAEQGSSAATLADNPIVPTVHPGATALVGQQLELLATSVFRWSGEAWPGTGMDWEISERQDQPQDGSAAEGVARIWNTRLAITLPKLGAIELRLSLSGASLHAAMAVGEDASMAALRNDADGLRQRLAGAGLQLSGLQVVSLTENTGA